MKIAALIPAYNPSANLILLVEELSRLDATGAIVVVNDGSGPECDSIFSAVSAIGKVKVLRHAVNLGKGAALKAGLNHIYCEFAGCSGTVTVDADGQHLVEDALSVMQELSARPETLILGARGFDRDVPARSMIGNTITRQLFRFLVGTKLTDTQCGLRGIPRSLIPALLKIESNGYEFELDMLMICKYSNIPIVEKPIRTVYIEENKSSHFNPLLDSMKIYFVLLRFSSVSLMTAVIDSLMFLLALNYSGSILLAQISGRAFAITFNYMSLKKIVFYSQRKHREIFPRYLLLVIVLGSISYFAIEMASAAFHIHAWIAKIIVETMLFLMNFAVQRDFIFTREEAPGKTDWNAYYDKPYRTATATRKITANVLQSLIEKYAGLGPQKSLVAELGGANSCFCRGIIDRFNPAQYHVYDLNPLGLDKMRAGLTDKRIYLHEADILNLDEQPLMDLVFSVGLIEHFSGDERRRAIEAHFNLLRPGGIAIISFPTPTWLYRITRFASESLGMWIFHDERPLKEAEFIESAKDMGKLLSRKIIWPIFLTQMIVVIRK